MTFWMIVGAVILGGVLLYLLPAILVILTVIGAVVLRIVFSRVMLVLLGCAGLFWLLLKALGGV